MPSRIWLEPTATELHVYVWIGVQELRAKIHDGRGWRGYLKVPKKNGGDPLIYQDPTMLGIITEFDDVETIVVALQEMGLSASAQFANEAARID